MLLWQPRLRWPHKSPRGPLDEVDAAAGAAEVDAVDAGEATLVPVSTACSRSAAGRSAIRRQ